MPTIISPINLHKIELGTQGWTAIINDNFKRLNYTYFKLATIVDVNVTGIQDRDILVYNAATSKWEVNRWATIFPSTSTTTTTSSSTTSSSTQTTNTNATTVSSTSSTLSTSSSTATTHTGLITQSTTTSSSTTSSSISTTTTAPPTTWNASDKSNLLSLSGGNLVVTHDATDGFGGIRSIAGKSSGKWYWEFTITLGASSSFGLVGVGNSSQTLSDHIGNATNGWGYYQTDGSKVYNDSLTAYGATFTTNDVIGIALDMDNGKVWFRKNGTWQNSGDPAAGTGEAFSGISGTIYAMVSITYHNNIITANFGGSAFQNSAPSGFNSGLK